MRVLVVGFGTFGAWFARNMKQLGHEVIVVERNGELVDKFADWATHAIQGDATEPSVLERAGARGADAAVISSAESLTTTILATVALRDLGVREIYAKVRGVNEARALDALDITEAIFPEREAAFRLAHRVVSEAVLDYTPLGDHCSIQEITVPPAWIGKTLLELAPREQHGVQIIAVRDALTSEMALPPDPKSRLKDSDSILVAGRDEALAKLGGRNR